MESWYTKLFSMTLVKVKMHLEGLNGWNEIVKPKKLKVIVWQRKLESHLTFFSKPNKTCNYQYCKWWLYIISNQPQQPAVQMNLILATHFGNGTDLRRSPLLHPLVRSSQPLFLLLLVRHARTLSPMSDTLVVYIWTNMPCPVVFHRHSDILILVTIILALYSFCVHLYAYTFSASMPRLEVFPPNFSQFLAGWL